MPLPDSERIDLLRRMSTIRLFEGSLERRLAVGVMHEAGINVIDEGDAEQSA